MFATHSENSEVDIQAQKCIYSKLWRKQVNHLICMDVRGLWLLLINTNRPRQPKLIKKLICAQSLSKYLSVKQLFIKAGLKSLKLLDCVFVTDPILANNVSRSARLPSKKESKPLIDNIRCYPLIATKYMQNSRSFFFSLKIWVQIRFLWQKRLVVWDRLDEQMGILARRITRRVIRQDRRICRKQRQMCHIDMSKIHFQK